MRAVVVGAGLAGLTAAADLAALGWDVDLVEARDRVGGRVKSVNVSPGSFVDAGGAYLGEKHTSLISLLDEHAVELMETSVNGDSVFYFGHQVAVREGRFPPLSVVALGDMFEAIQNAVDLLRCDEPWLIDDARKWDEITVLEWAKDKIPHRDAQTFLPLFLGEMMAADPNDVSVLHMAFYLKSGGGIRYMNAFAGGAQQYRIMNGASSLAIKMADSFTGRTHLSSPVRSIRNAASSVEVVTDRHRFEADVAVVSIPPLLATELTYSPGVVAPRSTPNLSRGCAIKAQLIYPKAKWKDYGQSGWSVSEVGPLLSTLDDSPADGSVGVLTGFITGAAARAFSGLALPEQEEAVELQATKLFPYLPRPDKIVITDWTREEYSRGCYAALFGPGEWSTVGPTLTVPSGRIYWAGTETSLEYFGLMEGAVRSGHRVASQIANAMDLSKAGDGYEYLG